MRSEHTRNKRADSIIKFLEEILEHQPHGYAFLATRGNWDRLFYDSHDLRHARRIVLKHIDDDLYFCPTTFCRPQRKRDFALPSAFSHCDCDEGSLSGCEIWPSKIIFTSPNRSQALWKWDRQHPPLRIEDYNYSIVRQIKHDSKDKSGWEITKFLRVPGTFNHKYEPPELVEAVCTEETWITGIHDRPHLMKRVSLANAKTQINFDNLPNYREVLRKYRKPNLFPYLHPAPIGKRSDVIWKIMMTLAEQDATPRKIASVVLASGSFKSKSQEIGDPLRWLEGQIGRAIATAEKGSR